MTANMQIKGNAATPALREKLRFLIKNESSYPISENLIERLIDMGTIICLHSGEPIVSAGDVAPDFYILTDGNTVEEGTAKMTEVSGMPELSGILVLSAKDRGDGGFRLRAKGLALQEYSIIFH